MSMSRSLTIDHRSCSDKDTKEERQAYVPYVRTTDVPVVSIEGPWDTLPVRYRCERDCSVNVPCTTV